jgi:uncharacterized protein
VYADTVTLDWFRTLREEISDVDFFDAHTHIGSNDPDEYRCTAPELIERLELIDGRAAVFPMHEPDGYPPANDMVIEEAQRSGGRLVAYCRLDPEARPLAEAERALDAGAVGIKLHPRAESFRLDHPALRDVFALADDRRLPVIVHAGRGIPALGRHAADLTAEFPNARVILAHAGICDLGWIWRVAQEQPNLYFDTSWWSASDLLMLFARIPPGQILSASDAPYGTPAFGAGLDMRFGLQAGLTPKQMRGVLGGQVERLVAGEEPLDLGPAVGDASLTLNPLLDRVHTFLVTALGQALLGNEPEETLQLAALACEVGDDAPEAPVCRSILALIETRERYEPKPGERPPRFAKAPHFIVMASALARTPDVPLPPDPLPADVGERQAAG